MPPFEKGAPQPVELLSAFVELREGASDRDGPWRPKNRKRRRICVHAHAHVVEDHNGVERVLEDCLELALRVVSAFTLLTPRKVRAVHAVPEDEGEQNDGNGTNEKRTDVEL